ncbi:uncharacterized protein LOC118470495 [Amphiprion ocellaris]|uniref:uncharacterized protein LOC118470495 n=1 Tax=Amphiprion ocellaris TaxID=80972 RepID=UPI001649C255|nr:uncharacterized protein LOC118470495 [Amphiprion ocellaris]
MSVGGPISIPFALAAGTSEWRAWEPPGTPHPPWTPPPSPLPPKALLKFGFLPAHPSLPGFPRSPQISVKHQLRRKPLLVLMPTYPPPVQTLIITRPRATSPALSSRHQFSASDH